MNIPNAPLKAIFFMHFILTTWGTLTPWLSQSFIYYNGFFLAFLVWSIIRSDSSEPIFMALMTDAASVLLDIVLISVYYDTKYEDSTQKFSMGMCILNLLVRPLSVVVLYRVYQERAGSDITNIFSSSSAGGGPTQAGGLYENLDRAPAHYQPVPPATGTHGPPGPPSYHTGHAPDKQLLP